MILRDCQHNSPDGLLSTASSKIVTYLDEAVQKSGEIPGRIAAGFWDMAGRLGRFSSRPSFSSPSQSTGRALSSSIGTRHQPDWTKPAASTEESLIRKS
jgi:hypothetical protein